MLLCSVHVSATSGANGLPYPLGDVRNCARVQGRDPNNPLLRVDVLPGLGFDNLRNLDLGQVLDYNYSTCQVSGDGLYLLPDSVYLIPVQESRVDMFAEYFDIFQEYTSHTAASINSQYKRSTMFSSVSGSFSADYQSTKSKMFKYSSNCARVSLRYKLYTVHIAPDAQLHGAFKSRLLDIAANIQNNNTKLAHYLAESLVRDYGTHVITSIDAGAGLSKITFVSKLFLQQLGHSNRSMAISRSAGRGFLIFFHASSSFTATFSQNDQYEAELNSSTTSSHILTYGGPMFRIGNFSLTDWENGVRDHLVAIDRSGVPLHSVINSNNIPELPDSTLLNVMDYVYKAVTRYYKVNTITGCMNSSSPNFNFQANLDDGSCNEERTTHLFGGIYQTCTTDGPDDFCSSYRLANPATEGYSCPPNYISILLYTGTLGNGQKPRECRKHCAFFNLFCHENCWTYELVYPATYNAYWCAHAPHSPPNGHGIMFGGVYTSSQQNVVTGSSSCPPHFYAVHFGENIWVCVNVGKNITEGAQYSIPFGGFHSCTNGNPMVSTSNQFNKGIYPHRCGKHYSQFLVTIDEGCDIYYCADTASQRQQQPAQPQPPKLPPYHALPRMSLNVTNTLVVRGTNGKVWIKNDDGTWQEYKDGQQTSKEYLMSLAQEAASPNNNNDNGNTDNGDNSGGSIAVMVGVVIGSVAGTVLVGAVIMLLVFGIRKVKHSRRVRRGNEQRSSSAYLVINDETDSTARSHGSTDTANSNV